MPYNDRLDVWELLFVVGLTILIAAIPMTLVCMATVMILGHDEQQAEGSGR